MEPCMLCAEPAEKPLGGSQGDLGLAFFLHKILQVPLEACVSHLNTPLAATCEPCSVLLEEGLTTAREIDRLQSDLAELQYKIKARVNSKAAGARGGAAVEDESPGTVEEGEESAEPNNNGMETAETDVDDPNLGENEEVLQHVDREDDPLRFDETFEPGFVRVVKEEQPDDCDFDSEEVEDVEVFEVSSMYNGQGSSPGGSKLEAFLSCLLCRERVTFLTPVALNQHYATVHPNAEWRCYLCSKKFTTKKYLGRHFSKSHNMKMHQMYMQCPLCDAEFDDSNQIKLHYDQLHPNGPWICRLCGVDYQTRFKLRIHMKQTKNCHLPKRKRGGKPKTDLWQPNRRYGRFAKRGKATALRSGRNGLKRAVSATVSSSGNINSVHENGTETAQLSTDNHEESKASPSPSEEKENVSAPEQIPVSQSSFGRRRRSVSTKVAATQSVAMTNYSCLLCDDPQASATHLYRHYLSVHPEAPWKCYVCNEIFSAKERLYYHRLTVHRNLPINRSRPDKYGPKPPRQPSTKSLKSKTDLIRFFKKGRLTGSGKGDYMCLLCDKIYKYPVVLESHYAREHPGATWSCKECGKDLGDRKQLYIHRKREHVLKESEPSGSTTVQVNEMSSEDSLSDLTDLEDLYELVPKTDNQNQTEVVKEPVRETIPQERDSDNLRSNEEQENLREKSSGSARFVCCLLCDEKFWFETRAGQVAIQMRDHYVSVHRNDPWKCKVCAKVFNNKGSLRQHLLLHKANDKKPASVEKNNESESKPLVEEPSSSSSNTNKRVNRPSLDPPGQDERRSKYGLRNNNRHVVDTLIDFDSDEDDERLVPYSRPQRKKTLFQHSFHASSGLVTEPNQIEGDFQGESSIINNLDAVSAASAFCQTSEGATPATPSLNTSQDTILCICLLCDQPFVNNYEVKTHYNVAHPGEAWKCNVCLKVFATRDQLYQHRYAVEKNLPNSKRNPKPKPRRASHVPASSEQPTMAGKKRSSDEMLGQGQSQMDQDEPLKKITKPSSVVNCISKCTLCPRTFPNNIELYHHKKKEHSVIFTWKCTNCKKSFLNQEMVELHQVHCQVTTRKSMPARKKPNNNKRRLNTSFDSTRKQTPPNYSPPSSSNSQEDSPGVNLRELLASNAKRFRCEICGKEQATLQTLKLHKKWNHGALPTPYSSTSGSTMGMPKVPTASSPNTSAQLGSAQAVKPNDNFTPPLPKSRPSTPGGIGIISSKCRSCGLDCGSKGRLFVHYRQEHPEVKDGQCFFCEKSFGQMSTLFIHMRNSHAFDAEKEMN